MAEGMSLDQAYVSARSAKLIPSGIRAVRTSTVPVNEFPKIPQAIGNAAYSIMYGLSNPTAQANIQTTLQRSVIRKFVPYVNQRARLNPQQLHHMYEWNKVGRTSARLFNPVITRAGRRKATFTVEMAFLPSKTLVPLTKAQATPGPNGQVVNKRYRFTEKARVIEFGQMVTIRTRGKSQLAFDAPTGDGLVFSPGPIHIDYSTKPTYLQFSNVADDFFRRLAPPLTSKAMNAYARKVSKAASLSAVVLQHPSYASDGAAKAQGERTAQAVGPVML